MLRAYGPLLRTPGARPLVVSSLLARTAIAAIGLPIVFIAEDATGSFGVAGLALGAYWLGVAIGAPARGRLVDRRGARTTIPPLAVLTFVTLVAMPPVAELSAWLLVPLGLVGGTAMPPLFAVTRGTWRRLLGEGSPLLERAYAFEAVSQEGVYLVGPLAAGLGIATIGPGLALVAAASLMLPSALVYARLAPGAGGGDETPRTPIRVRGVQVLFGGVLLSSLSFGVVEVSVPAFAAARGSDGSAGVLLALFAGGGMLGGLSYGARTWTRSTPVGRFLTFSVLSVALYATLPLADSVAALGALLFVAGMPFTAGWVAQQRLLDGLVSSASDTEVLTWMTLGNGVGIAGGSAIGGAIVEASGTDAAFLGATAMIAAGVAVVVAGRRSL